MFFFSGFLSTYQGWICVSITTEPHQCWVYINLTMQLINDQQLSSVFSYMVLLGTIRASGHMIIIMIMAKCSGVLCSYSIFCSYVWLQIDCCVYFKSSKIECNLTVLSSSTTQMLYISSPGIYVSLLLTLSHSYHICLWPYNLFIPLPSSYLMLTLLYWTSQWYMSSIFCFCPIRLRGSSLPLFEYISLCKITLLHYLLKLKHSPYLQTYLYTHLL
jgi:hypothetical protein